MLSVLNSQPGRSYFQDSDLVWGCVRSICGLRLACLHLDKDGVRALRRFEGLHHVDRPFDAHKVPRSLLALCDPREIVMLVYAQEMAEEPVWRPFDKEAYGWANRFFGRL